MERVVLADRCSTLRDIDVLTEEVIRIGEDITTQFN
jgi:hypothetical protein